MLNKLNIKYLDVLKLIQENKITPEFLALYVISLAKVLSKYIKPSFYKEFIKEIMDLASKNP